MERYYDADGNDITEKVTKKFEDQAAAKIKEQTDKYTVLEEEAKKLREKDLNFENLKKTHEEAMQKRDKEFGDFRESVLSDKKNDVMKRFTNGNKEATEKIEAELKALGLPMDNAEQIETAIKKAAAIVAPEVKPFAAAGGHMGGKGTHVAPEQAGQETAEQRAARIKMGITDDMAQKYNPEGAPAPLIVDKK